MTRTELLTRMKADAGRIAELGQAVQVAVGAQPPTADDVAAIITAADVAKTMADQFKVDASGLVGKDSRLATDFERGSRQWSMGCRLLADGITTPSAKLTAMGKANVEQGANAMAEAIQKL